jgi:hypothetical protein
VDDACAARLALTSARRILGEHGLDALNDLDEL